jgi:hypothetical protein
MGVNFSMTTDDDPYPQDGNAYIETEILQRFTLGLSVLTKGFMVVEFKGRLNDETDYLPSFAIGCKNIHPEEWICPVGLGRDVGWSDDQSYFTRRNTEQYSLFAVATKDFGPYGVYTIGIGRGEFVGYGPRSYLFNTDLTRGIGHMQGAHHNDAVGLIWGGEILLRSPVFAVFEFDGRNFNVGAKIMGTFFQVGLAAVKLEHRLGCGSDWFYPRFSTGMTANYSILRRWLRQPMGTLNVIVSDASTGDPKRAVVSFPGTCIPSVQTDRGSGGCAVKVEPGTYWVRAGAPGFLWADKMVHVGENQTAVVYFRIRSVF